MSNENENILIEDIEVVGPGQMLSDARIALKLTQKNVADKLNFKLSLVKDIENEVFDKSLPETFNRGYLRNFAKLVAVNEEDVLASYEMLDIAEKQSAEMQSFSKLTKKQAENNRIMWVTYLIIAIIIGSTLVWLFQAQQETAINNPIQTLETKESLANNINKKNTVGSNIIETKNNIEVAADQNNEPTEKTLEVSSNELSSSINRVEKSSEDQTILAVKQELVSSAQEQKSINNVDTVISNQDALATSVIFTFKGDCWVNIFDATGERIAWGVKKADYIMKIKGVAPFSITLGKPERVLINYDGSDLDMSQFNRGNIAKFTLPLSN